MLHRHDTTCVSLIASIFTPSLLLASRLVHAAPSLSERQPDSSNPLNINWGPAPAPEDGPPLSASALRDTKYLPAQIGGIVGAYAVALVLVAITLLSLSKRRRERLIGAEHEDFEFVEAKHIHHQDTISLFSQPQHDCVPNFSYPSPTRSEFKVPVSYVYPASITSSNGNAPGIDPQVDQRIVQADRIMAQQQLEEMYKYAFEHEDAKLKGVEPDTPLPIVDAHRFSASAKSTTSSMKKEKNKPANLNLSAGKDDKSQSRTSSLLSALRSPKKKSVKGVSISSPIMTPKSGTFPRHDTQEIPMRHYAPQPPPPLPSPRGPLSVDPTRVTHNAAGAPLTPDISPESVQSIDERLGGRNALPSVQTHGRSMSQAPTEVDTGSATSDNSHAPLIGLPSSPKPGATFARPNPPSAVRTGGALPLRAYEPAMTSPTSTTHQTVKQTVFERKGPLSPMSARTPATAGAVPYSPYQPFTPVMPMTPSLVTKDDRKRMRKMVPKTPTLEMVRSADDIW